MRKSTKSKFTIAIMMILLSILAIGCGKEEVDTNITAELEANLNNNTTDIVITTNAIDGSVFEVYVKDSNWNATSGFAIVEDGVAKASLENDSRWKAGYLEAHGSFKFNLISYPQPGNIQEAYGEYGEKLSGELASENNKGGYNVDVKEVKLAYPNEELAKSASKREVKKEEVVSEEEKIEKIIENHKNEFDIDLDWRDVQYDIVNNLDKEFVVAGEAKLSNYYNYGYKDLEEEYFSVVVRPPGSSSREKWYLYFERESFDHFFQEFKKNDAFIVTSSIMYNEGYRGRQEQMAIVLTGELFSGY